MIKPAEYNLTIRKATDFNQLFEFQQPDESAMNLTGWAVKSQIRSKQRRDSDLIVEFTVTIPAPADGKIYLSLTDTQTRILSKSAGYYDILLVSPSDVDEIYVEGKVTIKSIVTEKL